MKTKKSSFFSFSLSFLLIFSLGFISWMPATTNASECDPIREAIATGDYADDDEYENLLDALWRCELSEDQEEEE